MLKVLNFSGLRFLIEKEHMPVDPITAGLLALAYFNQFLSTPAGQDFAKINNQLIVDILTMLHLKVSTSAPTKTS